MRYKQQDRKSPEVPTHSTTLNFGVSSRFERVQPARLIGIAVSASVKNSEISRFSLLQTILIRRFAGQST